MENSIEEALERLSTGKRIKMYELLRTFKKEGIENFVITRKKYVDVILSDYERVLKENEELKKFRRRYVDTTDKELQEANEYFCTRYTFMGDELSLHINTLLKATNNSIPIQKIKDKIEEIQNIANELYYNNYKGNLDDGKFAQKMAKKLEKVLKESEDNNARKRNKRAKI